MRRYSKEKLRELDEDNRIWWGQDGENVPAIKRFLSEVKQGRVPQTWWPYEEVGHNQAAKKELLRRVEFASSDSVFDTPKPVALIRRMLTLATEPDRQDVVLDFFAGSGTTGEAVLAANAEDGGDRRYIVVQAPEPTGHDDHPTVADITRARLRSVHEELGDAVGGLRDLRLAPSNFDLWTSNASSAEDLAEQLQAFTDQVRDDASSDGLLVEVLLKDGLPLDLPIRRTTHGGHTLMHVGHEPPNLVACFSSDVDDDLIEQLVETGASRVVLLEAAFAGADEVKTNASLRFADTGITFRTI